MSWFHPHEPENPQYCTAVRIGPCDEEAELIIFYTPEEEYDVHCGFLAEENDGYSSGRSYHRLKIVTSRGKRIFVRRYDDNGDFVVTTSGFWIEQKKVKL